MGQFKPEPKMKTTEPSVELKLKKGGKAKMADGGVPPMMGRRPVVAPVAREMPTRAAVANMPRTPARPAVRPGALAPMMRKKGGEVESAAEHKAEMKAIKGIKEEVKSHESKPASKAHKGLKTGGVANAQGGYKTGGVVNGQGGYKKGGLAKSGIIKNDAGIKHSTKMHEAKQVKRVSTKTGDIKQGPAGYKDGGFVAHSKGMSKHAHGHKVGGKMSSC